MRAIAAYRQSSGIKKTGFILNDLSIAHVCLITFYIDENCVGKYKQIVGERGDGEHIDVSGPTSTHFFGALTLN